MAELLPISSPLSAERRLDVVFVHGLGGDPITTWRSGSDENTSWPHWLALEFGSEIGVWSLGYAAAPTKWEGVRVPFFGSKDPDAGAAMSLPRRAENALDRLAGTGIGQRPVCFITHSLGGLLVKSILRRAADSMSAPERLQVVDQCRGVLFLATPHHGSRLADLASAIKGYLPSVSTLDLIDNDDHLMDLYEWYRGYAPRHHILTRSYYENRETQGVVIVVPRSSADPGITGETARGPTPLDRDLLEISRPRTRQDQAYIGSTQLIRLILSGECPVALPRQASSTTSSGPIAQPLPASPSHTLLVHAPLPKPVGKPLVYVSYAWRDRDAQDQPDQGTLEVVDREQIVDELCALLAEENQILVGRDKKLVKTGDSIEDFAGEIAKSGLILAVISKKSLRSKWYMKDELLQAFRRRNYGGTDFRLDVLPLILDDAEADFEDKESLIDFWSERIDRERKNLERVDPQRKFSRESWQDVDEMEELLGRLPDLLKVFKARKMPRGAEAIREEGFFEIRQLVLQRLQEKDV